MQNACKLNYQACLHPVHIDTPEVSTIFCWQDADQNRSTNRPTVGHTDMWSALGLAHQIKSQCSSIKYVDETSTIALCPNTQTALSGRNCQNNKILADKRVYSLPIWYKTVRSGPKTQGRRLHSACNVHLVANEVPNTKPYVKI